jgi:hypothetical protein
MRRFEMEAPTKSLEDLLTDERSRRRLLEVAKSILEDSKANFNGQVFPDLWREATVDIVRAIAKDLHKHWKDTGIVTDRMSHNRSLEEILLDSNDYLEKKKLDISAEILGRLRLRSWLWDEKFNRDMRVNIKNWMAEHDSVVERKKDESAIDGSEHDIGRKLNLSSDEVEVFVDKCIKAIHKMWQRTLDHYSEAIAVPKDSTLRGQGLPGPYVIPEDLEHLRMLSFGYLKLERLGATRLAPRPVHVTEIEDEEGESVSIYDKVADPDPIGHRAEQQSEIWLNLRTLAKLLPPEDADCVDLIKRFAEAGLVHDESIATICTKNDIPHAVLEKCLAKSKRYWQAMLAASSSEGEE